MKRLLFVLLMMTCSVSWAEWEYTTETNSFFLYHDKSTIRRNGEISQMWSLLQFVEVQNFLGYSYKSRNELIKYNCKDETSALVSVSRFSESMGKGKVTSSNTIKEREWEWHPVSPGSSGETSWEIACGKK
jgi:hypothetical protein